MNNTVLEFECVGMDNGGKFPIEYIGRGQDISPEFIIKNRVCQVKCVNFFVFLWWPGNPATFSM